MRTCGAVHETLHSDETTWFLESQGGDALPSGTSQKMASDALLTSPNEIGTSQERTKRRAVQAHRRESVILLADWAKSVHRSAQFWQGTTKYQFYIELMGTVKLFREILALLDFPSLTGTQEHSQR